MTADLIGSRYYVKSNREFLAVAFKDDFDPKHYYPASVWTNPRTKEVVWMITFGGSVNDGWRNSWVDNDTILEECFKRNPSTKSHADTRIVVDKSKGYYEILGVFEYDIEESTGAKNYFRRVDID